MVAEKNTKHYAVFLLQTYETTPYVPPASVSKVHRAVTGAEAVIERPLVPGAIGKLHLPTAVPLSLVAPLPAVLTPVWILVQTVHATTEDVFNDDIFYVYSAIKSNRCNCALQRIKLK